MDELDSRIEIVGTLASEEDLARLLEALESDQVSMEPNEAALDEEGLHQAVVEAVHYGRPLKFYRTDTRFAMDETIKACMEVGLGFRRLSGPAGFHDYTDIKVWEPDMEDPKEMLVSDNEPVVPLSVLRAAAERSHWAVIDLVAEYSDKLSETRFSLAPHLLDIFAAGAPAPR